ncbi:MAG: pyridoxal-dependent decarboxylase [Saprospiraceae bacterium]
MPNPLESDWKSILENEESLDPPDWSVAEKFGQRLVSDMVNYLKGIRDQPVWNKPSVELKEVAKSPWLDEPTELSEVYQSFEDVILPFPKGNIHPRFWSWVQGTGSITAAYADFMASIMNSNLAIGDHAGMYIEQQVIDWLNDLMGFPVDSASGILLSGGSMANITGLMIARNHVSPDIRKKGIQSIDKPLVFYASVETHSCQQKAAEALGLGLDSLRKIPVNDAYEMDTDLLVRQIELDIQNGFHPFCIVANVGTVNTGAIDPLDELVAICNKYHLWLHVDGAFGALVKLLPEYHHMIKAMSQADSIAFDLHKWMYLPYEVGCLLVRDKKIHRDAFVMQPNYLISHERGLSAGPDPIGNYGMELSRGFKALKVWFCFQEYGRKKYERLIRQNIAHCLYLADKINAHPQLELMAPVPMNIVCFRYTDKRWNQETLNKVNKEILMQLHERGIATPSYTILHGNYVIRVANVNHRSKKSDFDALVDGVIQIGDTLTRFT